MIKTIVKDVFFLGQKSTEATKEDLYLAKDLRDTLEFHKDACVGMAANMIGVKKRVIIVNIGFVNLVMFNPVLVASVDFCPRKKTSFTIVFIIYLLPFLI